MSDLVGNILQMTCDAGCSAASIAISETVENSVTARGSKIDKIHRADDRSLFLQLFSEGRYGTFSTNQLHADKLKSFIFDAASLTRLLQPDPFRSLPDSGRYYAGGGIDLKLYDNSIDGIDADTKKGIALECCRSIINEVQSVECEFGDSAEKITIADTQGFFGTAEKTTFTVSAECSLLDSDGSRPESYWWHSSLYFKDLDYHNCATKALERGIAALGAKKIRSGKYNVVIENNVASKVVAPILSALYGAKIQQGNSFLKDTLNKKVFSERLSITDSPITAGAFGARLFDSEGVATEKRDIIKDGVPQIYFLNTYYAAKMNMSPTTDSFSVIDVEPSVECGADGIIERCGNGILITGFNGGNHNSATADFSYGIKGFYFENGRIAYPIKEMNLTGNLLKMWNNVLYIGNDPLCISRMRIPSIAFEDLNVSGL